VFFFNLLDIKEESLLVNENFAILTENFAATFGNHKFSLASFVLSERIDHF
jgi:hypothetical protein